MSILPHAIFGWKTNSPGRVSTTVYPDSSRVARRISVVKAVSTEVRAMQFPQPPSTKRYRVLRADRLPSVALVGQRIDSPPALTNIREGVREALNSVELPSGSVAIGVGSGGVARIGEVVAALVEALKESGAEPLIVPAMGSHGASTAEGQARGSGAISA